SLPRPAELKRQLKGLLAKLRPAGPGRPTPVLVSLRHSLAALQARLAEVPDGLAARRLQNFEERLTGGLGENLYPLRAVSTPAAITATDLPESLRTRYIGKSGKWLLRVFAKDCLWDHAPLRQFVEKVKAVDPEATGKPFSTLEGLQALKD